ncbi:MAG TPA: kelch repeat-containing protein [Planctomycetota bacterium]|nr:kelch repeat-containing protein [Planctomycetota bacterium]
MLPVRILAAFAFPLAVGAQATQWTLLAPVASPAARWFPTVACDEARQQVVLFGGNNIATTFADTWLWNGATWQQASPASAPTPRFCHSMAYDAARQRVVLFGGYDLGSSFGDTWLWDGTNWTNVSPASSPSPRILSAMAYDATRQRIVLFGGDEAIGGGGALGDTWLWDGTTWSLATPAISPGNRSGHAMAYDAARQRVVMFGGDDGAFFTDTWEWDGTSWLQRTSPAHPPGRRFFAMAYDAQQQVTTVFGGYGGAFLGDTWHWNGSQWTSAGSPGAPAPRHGVTMTYDLSRQRALLFGGGGTLLYGDTWNDRPAAVPAVAAAYGNGCGTPALDFVPDANARPLLGQVARATIANAPTLAAGVALGFSDQSFGMLSLPLSLAGAGMAGCDLLQSADVLGLGATPQSASTLSFALAVPQQPSLLGNRVFLQAYALAPGVNPAQWIVSNGVAWSFGDL